MEDLVLISILLLRSTNGEAPPAETLAIVPELDTTNTAGVYSASSAYSNYQPTAGYTTPAVNPYPSTRPYSVSSTYLPVIPVSTSYYTLARPPPVYGVPYTARPWPAPSAAWAVNAAQPWPSAAPWSPAAQPWPSATPWSAAAAPWAYGAPGYNYDNPNLVGIKPPL
ncbi:uncharacterized protein LOC111061085 [Nilaparvata lugens]|uniref:uncharacterized protein LOC111061085 n=1 Tax=Nilaparvata lugens TaxID=108931 RepID=UPI00193E3FD4|nr:uncharacterized protein LOC111061085 [Nilaparvata lugens]